MSQKKIDIKQRFMPQTKDQIPVNQTLDRYNFNSQYNSTQAVNTNEVYSTIK